ncbi:MAG: hypothetical protein AABY85_06515 [Gemmatimonadota bacterium]
MRRSRYGSRLPAFASATQGTAPRSPLPTIHLILSIRPFFRPALILAMISGVIRLSSCLHALDFTRTNSVPSCVTDSHTAARAISGPTNLGHSSTIVACSTRRAMPADLR